MNTGEDFIIVLPSNTPSANNANTASKYLTTFNDPFILDGEWCVALMELQFKNSIETCHTDYAVVQEYITTTKAPRTTSLLNVEVEKDPQSFGEFTRFIDAGKQKLKGWKTAKLEDARLITEIDETVSRFYTDKTGDFEMYFLPIDAEIDLLRSSKVYINNKSNHRMTMKIPKTLSQIFGFTKIDSTDMITYSTELVDIVLEKGYNTSPFPSITVKNKLPILPRGKKYVNADAAHRFSISFHPISDWIEKHKFTPKPGMYATANELETELNSDSTLKTYFKFKLDERLNRFEIQSVKRDAKFKLLLYNGLDNVLGFTKTEFTGDKESFVGEMEVDLLRGISNVFVYSDVCEPIRVGNTFAPLLRNVLYNPSKYGTMINITYNNPIYIKTCKSFIDNIQIMLCDSVGELIPFREGLTTCTLHFKRL